MKKRRLGILLLTLILTASAVLLPTAAMAAEPEYPAGVLQDEESRGRGDTGELFDSTTGFYFSSDDGSSAAILGYVGQYSGGDLIIPEQVSDGYNSYYEVTRINTEAFALEQGKTGFTGSVILPDTLTDIGNNAFCGQKGLSGDLTIPDSVKTIGEGAFDGCSGFGGNLKLGSGLEKIGAGAFRECGFTGKLQIPASVSYIGNQAFWMCSGFTGGLSLTGNNMVIGGNSVQDPGYLDKSVFYQCHGFSGTLTIGEGVTQIAAGAFYDLPNINRVVNNSDQEINLSSLDKTAMVIDDNDSPWTDQATGKRITKIARGTAVRDDYDGSDDGEENQEENQEERQEEKYTKKENTFVAGQNIQDFGQTYFKDYIGLITKYRATPKKVATVSKKGVLKAKKPGVVTVEALTGKGKNAVPIASCTITILEKPKLKFPKFTRESVGTKLDGYQYFLTPSTRTTKADFWESSKASVAQVDPATGEITVMGPGTTKITAYFGTPGMKGTLKVRAKLKVKK